MKFRSLLAPAFLYFAIVFAAGFLLGTLRVMVIAPATGDENAILIELPVMLAIAYAAAMFCVRRFQVPSRIGARIAMGSLAFLLLMTAEIVLGVLLVDRTVMDQLAFVVSGENRFGFAAQIVFALMPLILLRQETVRRRLSGT